MLELVAAVATVLGTLLAILQWWSGRNPPPPAPADTALVPNDDDAAAWALASRDDTPVSYDDYLQNRPNGYFALRAKEKFVAITAGKLKVVTMKIDEDAESLTMTRTQNWFAVGASFTDDVNSDYCGPDMVIVPSGSFVMGSHPNEEGSSDNEQPAHKVDIAKPFAVGKFPIRFDDWALFHEATGGKRMIEDEGWGAGERPVIKVTWERAKQYVEWLSETTEMPYRLLSEAEWEYCCRAGTKTPYATGKTINTSQACFYADKTTPVGKFPPNVFGIHDMHGNIWEWCEDYWHDDYIGAPTDGSAWLVGGDSDRIVRGGCWTNDETSLRSANRAFSAPAHRDNRIGFRVARGLEPASA